MGETRVVVHRGGRGFERNSAVFESCLESHLPPHASFIYLVTTSWRQRQLTERFKRAVSHAFQIPIFTLPALVVWLLRLDPQPLTPVGDLEKSALLLKLLGQAPGDRGGRTKDAPEAGSHRPGDFPISLAARFITHVKQQNIHSEEMLRLRYAKSETQPGPLEESLVDLFGRYQRCLLENSLEDAEDRFARLYEALLTGRTNPANRLPAVRRLVIEGNCGRPPLHSALLRMLCRSFPRIDLSLEDEGGQSRVEPYADLLEGLTVDYQDHVSEKTPPQMRRLDLPTQEEEVIAVARQIGARTRDVPSIDSESAAVICTGREYGPLIEEIFSERGIPYFDVSAPAYSVTGLIALIEAYLDLLVGDFQAHSLFDFLRRLPRRPFSPSQLKRLESAARLASVESGYENWVSTFPELLEKQTELEAGISRELASEFCSCVRSLRLDIDKDLPLLEWYRGLLASLECGALPPPCRLDDSIGSAEASLRTPRKQAQGPGPRTQGAQYLQVRRLQNKIRMAVEENLVRIAGCWGSDLVDFSRFRELLQLAIERLRIPQDRRHDAVAVGTPEQLQQCHFRDVFWLGLNDGQFPRPPAREPLADEIHRHDLGLPSWNHQLAEEERLFALAAQFTSGTLTLSRCTKAVSGATLPSPLLENLRGIKLVGTTSEVFSVTSLGDDVRRAIGRGLAAELARRSSSSNAYQGGIGSDRALEILRQRLGSRRLELKPTQIEEYVRCGFRYLIERVLRVRPQEPDGLNLSPRLKGTLIHNVLHGFMTGIEDTQGGEADREAWLSNSKKRMLCIVNRELATLSRGAGPRTKGLLQALRRQLTRGLQDRGRGILADFIDQQWHHLQAGQPVGLEEKAGPVPLGTVPAANQDRLLPIVLQGRLDRVDQGPRGLSVIDYKTGLDERRRVFNGWGYQLPLYISLAESRFGDAARDAGFYQIKIPDRIRYNSIRAKWQGDAAAGFERLQDYYRKKTLSAAQSLYSGRFQTTLLGPSKAGCRTCGLARVCRFDPSVMEAQRRQFPDLLDETLVERGHWTAPVPAEEGGHG